MADDAERDPEPSRTTVEVRWVIAAFLAVVFGIFIAQNSDRVAVDFVFFTAQIRLIWVFLICGILGGVIDRLLQRRGIL